MKKIICLIVSVFIIITMIFSAIPSMGIIQEKSMQHALYFPLENPHEAWNKTFGGSTLDWGWSVQETSDTGFIIAGETTSYGAGNYDAWLIKTDSEGDEQWNKTFGGSDKDGARSVQQTSDNGYILGGYVDSLGFPGHDAWFIKTDSDGNEQWNRFFGGPASDGTFDVCQTKDDGYIGTGYADSFGAGSHDVWVIKTDLNGNEEWNKTYGTVEWDTGYKVKQTEDDGFIIIGTTQSYGSGNQDAWLLKLDSNGNEEWNNTYGGIDNDWGSSVCMDDDGGYVISGDTRSYGTGGYDVWLIKTDNFGNELWRRTYGESLSDDTGYSLKKTIDGGYIITGTKTYFDSDLTDVWLIKTDSDGYMRWNLTIDGGDDDWSYSVDETSDGGFIITGLTNSYGNGYYDVWLIKVETENHPPDKVEINGPKEGKTKNQYNYTFETNDPEKDTIYYEIHWGDETPTPLLGPYKSGEKIKVSHTWSKKGTYIIKARAKDELDIFGEWGTMEVTMPIYKNINIQYNLLYQLFERCFNKFQPLLELISKQ